MASVGASFACCVCKERISDPYYPPCGHALCPRHRHQKTCCICQEGCEATDLHGSTRQRTQQHPVRDRGAGEGETLSDGNGTGKTPCSLVYCSNCQRQIPPEQMEFCSHCKRKVCVQCCGKHCDSYRMMLRVNLDILSCYKANLKARGMENTKEKIAAALEEAVSKMLGAASKALDAAIAKVKEAHLASSETISRLVPRITKLSIEIATVQDVQNGLNENKGLQMAMKMREMLKKHLTDAEILGTKMKQMLPLPVMQVCRSDYSSKVSQLLNTFGFLMSGETVLLPQSLGLSTRCKIKDQRRMRNYNN